MQFDHSLVEMFRLGGRRALVTGGSLGIGRAVSSVLAGAGASVAVQFSPSADAAAGQAEAASALCGSVRAGGGEADAIAAEFDRDGEAARCAAAAAPVDILVLCASVQTRTPFLAVGAAEIARQVAINFAASVALLQAVLPGMAARGWGRVLSIGSVNATRPHPDLAVYAALKAAQHNLIVNLARDYAGRGVTLNTLSPGLVETERNAWRRADASDWAAIQRAANPMGRAGLPGDMAGAALLLCSEAGAFITGADLQATGGGHL